MNNKDTHREHFVPRFFIKQFYAKEDQPDKNAKKGMICCYDLQKHKQHPARSDDVFFQKDLYETAASDEKFAQILSRDYQNEAVINYFEHEFGKIETNASNHFKKLLSACYREKDRSKVLSCNQVNYFIKYMVLQLLRIPQYLELQIDTVDETFFEGQNICKSNSTTEAAAKHLVLSEITHSQSDIIDKIHKTILFNHDMCICKLTADCSFFSSNVPIFFFDYHGDGNVFAQSTIVFPISPKYCITFFKCKYKQHTNDIHKKLIFVDKEVYNKFVYNFIQSATDWHEKIFSDSISTELMQYIQQIDTNKD